MCFIFYRTSQFSDLLVYGCILVIALMIGNAYSSKLASVMTIPRFEPAIETVQQLSVSDYQWAATHDAWIFSILAATQVTHILFEIITMILIYKKNNFSLL